MLIDGYWLQIQDSRMQPRHCANYRPTDTLSIEWWQTGWLLSGNKDRAFLLSCGQTTWTPGFSGFWKSLNHHITIIKSSSMNEDSKECSTTVCIQWHASVIVAEKTLTKLAAAGGHELVRQGCFFCLAGALLVPLSTWLSFTANPHAKCFSRKNTHADVFKTWNSLPSAGLDFRKEKHHQRTQDRLPDLLRQNLCFFSWFRLGVGWLSISLFRLRRSFTRRTDIVWHFPPQTSWWSLRLLLGRLLLGRRFRWCLCLHHVLSDDSQIFARHNLKQMLSFAARSVRLIACSWMHMWTVWHYHNLIAAISMRLINCMCLCTWVWTTSDQLTQPTLASQSSKMPRSARQAAWFKFFDKIRTSQTIFNGSVFPTNIAAGHLKVSAWHIFFFEPNLDSNSTRPGR